MRRCKRPLVGLCLCGLCYGRQASLKESIFSELYLHHTLSVKELGWCPKTFIGIASIKYVLG